MLALSTFAALCALTTFALGQTPSPSATEAIDLDEPWILDHRRVYQYVVHIHVPLDVNITVPRRNFTAHGRDYDAGNADNFRDWPIDLDADPKTWGALGISLGSDSGAFEHVVQFDIPTVGNTTCVLRGELRNTTAAAVNNTVFEITTDRFFLHPCGDVNGVKMICNDPASYCRPRPVAEESKLYAN